MKILIIAAMLALPLSAVASQKSAELPCRLKAEIAAVKPGKLKTHKTEVGRNDQKGFKTSVGAVSWDLDDLGQTIPLINGKRLGISKSNQGSFGNGKIYDLGGKVVLAYQVIRMEDSESDPSNLTLLVGPKGAVSEQFLVAGEKAAEYACSLVK